MSERTDLLLVDRRRRALPRLAELGVDRDRALPRGGRRVLVDRAERDRPCAGALRAGRGRARDDSGRARVRPHGQTSTAARHSCSCGAWSGRGRSRATGCTRPPTRSGSPRSRPPTTRRSRASPRRWIARRRTTACTPRCGSTASSRRRRGATRLDEAVDELWPYALGVLDDELRPELRRRAEERLGRELPDVEPVSRGVHEAELAAALGGDDDGPPLGSGGCAMVRSAKWL